MRASVLAAFPSFSAHFEGRLNYMYTDVKGLVTTGVGNLIDPIGGALGLPWKHLDGSDADQASIEQEWNTVKSAWPGVQSTACKSITQLHLTESDIDGLVQSRAHSNEDTLRGYFPGWDDFPADAQLGILSMSWALGAGFPAIFKLFTAAANAGNWREAATQSAYKDTDAGNMARKAANTTLFTNAAVVTENGGDPDVLYYPNAVQPGQVQAPSAVSPVAKTVGIIGLAAAGIATAMYFFFRGRA